MRAAIYFTPPADDPLTQRAAEWLGRCAFSNRATRGREPVLDPMVAEPARYGFHATMKAPFRLADGTDLDALTADFEGFCETTPASRIGTLALVRLGRFLALTPSDPQPGLQALAERAVRHFEAYRAPLSDVERARRRPETLTARQNRYLEEWGYPYVFEEFRFHMTLTGPLNPGSLDDLEERLAARFAPFLGHTLAIDGLALFIQTAADRPFVVHAYQTLQQAEMPAS